MADDRHHLSIGRFAGLTGISANTLRRYDETGLLCPAFTDPFTGYRLYAIEQLDTGILIRLLRDLDVPLDEISALLRHGDSGDVTAVLAHHRDRVAVRRQELDRILERIDAALSESRGLLPYEVELVELEPVWVVSRRATTPRPRLDECIERCLAELEDELAGQGACPRAREFVLYPNVLTWYQGVDLEVCLPVEQTVAERGSGSGRLVPGGPAMQTLYRGPWDDIWQAYAAVLARIARSGHEVSGPVREAYLVDESDTDDPREYVTELTLPVQPVTSSAPPVS